MSVKEAESYSMLEKILRYLNTHCRMKIPAIGLLLKRRDACWEIIYVIMIKDDEFLKAQRQ